MELAFRVLSTDEPGGDLARLATGWPVSTTSGAKAPCDRSYELALDIAESLQIPEIVSQALNKALVLCHRPTRSRALLREALQSPWSTI